VTSESILAGLAEWSIRAALLAAVAFALLSVFRIKNAHLRISMWTIVLVTALLMPIAAAFLPHISITVPALLSRPHSSDANALLLPLPAPRTPLITSRSSYRPSWEDVTVAFWLLVAMGMLFRLAIGLRLSARLIRSSRPVDDGVLESDRVRVPITVGLFRPMVVLPSDWRQWPEHQLRAVLAHERAHAARRDPLYQFLASVYRAIAWFHPLAWWLRSTLVDLAEHASDDAAISAGEDRIRYAETLLSFIERTPQRVEWEGVTMATKQTRMRRIDRILDHKRNLSRPSARRAAALVTAALPLIYLATVIRPVSAQPQAAGRPAIQPINPKACGGDPAFGKWLTQDVAYIVAPEERQAFERLGTAQECSMFIEQFWQRRDPTPGTPANEFKEEHYRRIAYANEHYSTNRATGWQTDRGRVYITYGPPDEIESHPSGGAPGHSEPFEQWLYHHLDTMSRDTLVEFRDIARDNEYPLFSIGGDQTGLRGPIVFGRSSDLQVEVRNDRTIFITTPVGHSSTSIYGRIIDHDGALVQTIEDIARGDKYGKSIATPLAPGQYTLQLQAGGDDRSTTFEVK
jgi:GWxTD domain-containing protein